ncbi:MAG TPA: ABC transporter C-terminal domain-containing protein, partial [Bacillota bacterium]|nr:ABC transporter C-terminal domain-containing protein [Bacillota bacterium]
RDELKQKRREEYRRRLERQRRERRLQEEQARLEDSITAVERNIARLEKTLASPEHYGDYSSLLELNSRLEEEKERLAAYLARWEEISLQLEQIAPE